MRKVNKRNVTMHVENDYKYIIERINNDKNGNPRYNLMVFENGYYLESYNIQAYNDIQVIEKYKKNAWYSFKAYWKIGFSGKEGFLSMWIFGLIFWFIVWFIEIMYILRWPIMVALSILAFKYRKVKGV